VLAGPRRCYTEPAGVIRTEVTMPQEDRPPIRTLDEVTASRIAAGEVVERPASVVKELVENALDAGASSIVVEIEAGGRRLVRVTDDGHGIAPDQLELAIARHATSKIVSADDLDRVRSLGFRGEALAAIASVSHLTIVSRVADRPAAARIHVDSGRITAVDLVSAPTGTRVTVENLFHAQPARLKFLRTDQTEAARVADVVGRCAVAYPHVRMELWRDGHRVLLSDGTGDATVALAAVFGSDVASQLVPVSALPHAVQAEAPLDLPTSSVIRISGFASPPHVHRATRRDILLFVNRRPVRDASLSAAVVQAYEALLPGGRYPVAAIAIEMSPAQVDVNVHPAKTEVRFRDERRVFAAVLQAVRAAVSRAAGTPAVREAPWSPVDFGNRDEALGRRWHAGADWSDFIGDNPAPRLGSVPSADERLPDPRHGETGWLPPLRVLGQVGLAFIVAEGPDGVYVVDQHAAHERILFDRLTAAPSAPATQLLLSPVVVPLPADAAARAADLVTALGQLGYQLDDFGTGAVLVRGVPQALAHLDAGEALHDTIALADLGRSYVAETLRDRLAVAACKRGAVKAGQALTLEAMRSLLRDLEASPSPRTCPHGRPTVVVLTAERIQREFGRT
jgi:DNA mismatch repair protein MutL